MYCKEQNQGFTYPNFMTTSSLVTPRCHNTSHLSHTVVPSLLLAAAAAVMRQCPHRLGPGALLFFLLLSTFRCVRLLPPPLSLSHSFPLICFLVFSLLHSPRSPLSVHFVQSVASASFRPVAFLPPACLLVLLCVRCA